jgi:superfamily II DNA helicase RecQ
MTDHFIVGEFYTDETAQLLFLSVEHVENHQVHSFINSLHKSKRLARIVVDECHLAVTWSDFRPLMFELKSFRSKPVPWLLLSATVTPSMEQTLRLHFGSNFKTIRKQTMRPELLYSVQSVSDSNNLHTTILDQLKLNWTNFEDGRAIVFCLFTSETEELCELVNNDFKTIVCGYYHGQMPLEDRQRMFQDWLSGKIKVMAATKAFGTGIDFPKIRLLIHKGQSSSLLEYAQETGRGGRDGRLARCITMYNEQYCNGIVKLQKSQESKEEAQRMKDFLKVQRYNPKRRHRYETKLIVIPCYSTYFITDEGMPANAFGQLLGRNRI